MFNKRSTWIQRNLITFNMHATASRSRLGHENKAHASLWGCMYVRVKCTYAYLTGNQKVKGHLALEHPFKLMDMPSTTWSRCNYVC